MPYNIGNERRKKTIITNKLSYNDFIANYDKYINLYNFDDGDKIYYGLKNRNNLEIIPKLDKIFVNITYGIIALDFVVAAYEELAISYSKLLSQGQISQGFTISKYIDSPKKSLIAFDMEDIFTKNKENFFKILINNHDLALQTTKIKNFINCYTNNINLLNKRYQTHIAYFKSNQPKNINGLTINLIDEDYNNDQEKVNFMLDPNFLVYRKLAEQYGFYVNKDAPWQLIANLSSPNLHKIIKQLNLKQGLINKGISVDVIIAMQDLGIINLKMDKLLEIEKSPDPKKPSLFEQLLSRNKFTEQDLHTLKKYVSEVNQQKMTPDDIIKDYYDILLFIDFEKQKEFFYDAYSYIYNLRNYLTDSYFCGKTEETKTNRITREEPPDKDKFMNSNNLLFLYSYLTMLNTEHGFKYSNFQLQKIKHDVGKMYYSDKKLDTKKPLLYIYSKFETLIL